MHTTMPPARGSGPASPLSARYVAPALTRGTAFQERMLALFGQTHRAAYSSPGPVEPDSDHCARKHSSIPHSLFSGFS